ncbi:hypothetical protein BOX15_Mlig014777g2 [Macrostomum lignano]|uniref:Eukaryotic translation initiation factor 2 subunit 2 n=2 Tax=Macrostomum lignano TaxID=282301 RepID=A0A267DIE3_9PLAT|nr:hypothetical protein BOX15_Mlig014777g2 [Macrostomum lignano]
MEEPAEPMFDPSIKKKNKKKELAEETPAVDEELEADFNLETKKKKKPPKERPAATAEQPEEDGGQGAASAVEGDGSEDKDYSYSELLSRAFRAMMERNPDMLSEKKKVVMKPPSLMRVGTKKTAFANFTEISKQIRRKPDHLLAYLLTELGTTGSVDGNNQLIIKGRFQTKNIESVLRSYIKEYVMCHTCRSHDTELVKETRLFFLQCSTCGSRCSVASIKSGFQAQVGRRAAQRAKAT